MRLQTGLRAKATAAAATSLAAVVFGACGADEGSADIEKYALSN